MEPIELYRLRSSDSRQHPTKLEEIRMRSIKVFDPIDQDLKTPTNLLYYREPTIAEYPLNLNDGFENYIERDETIEWHRKSFSRYLQIFEPTPKIMHNMHFCTNRKAMQFLMVRTYQRDYKWVATKYRGCIYLENVKEENFGPQTEHQKRRATYNFKMRQFVFADSPGEIPNTSKPIDENKQLFAVYTAKLGKFNLIYAAEIPGLLNTEVLTDITNPDVVEKCKPVSIKVFKGNVKFLKRDSRLTDWMCQAYVGGFEKIKVGIFDDNGIVRNPIKDFQCSDHHNSHNISGRVQDLSRFLTEINYVMAKVDDPNTVYLFTISRGHVTYEIYEGQNEYSFLGDEYIQFINTLD